MPLAFNSLCTGLAFLCLLLPACASSDFVPPETRQGAGEWQDYVGAPTYSVADCASLKPGLESPEGAVVYYLSSRARGDEAWLQALVPEAQWDGRLRRKVEAWSDWKVTRFQLRRKRYDSDEHITIEVFMGVEFKGHEDSGSDVFEVVRAQGKWLVMMPPT